MYKQILDRLNAMDARLSALETQETGGAIGTVAATANTIVKRGASAEINAADANLEDITAAGNLTFSGTARRILADFSNGTVSNRAMFQGTGANAQTAVYAIPNGTSNTAQFSVANSSDPNNAAILQTITGATELYLNSTVTGTGTLRALLLKMNSTTRLTVGTDGSVDAPTFKYRSTPWTRVTSFSNSWVDARGAQNSYVSPSYYQDETGKVFLTGAVSSGTTNTTAFALPAGLRPTYTEIFHCAATGASSMCRVDVMNDGGVKPVTASPGTVFLDGISFYPAAYDGSFTAVTFQNSWVDYGAGYQTAGYYKDLWGRVHIRGLIKSGTVGAAFFNLPSGYRVWRNSIRPNISNDAYGRLDYYSNGNVLQSSGSNAWASLAGVMYPDAGTAPESAWQPLGNMVSPWVDYDAVNWSLAAHWIDPGGRVHWNGLIKSGTGVGMLNIPAGLVPHQVFQMPMATSGGAKRVEVWPTVYPLATALPTYDATWTSFGGVHYLRL